MRLKPWVKVVLGILGVFLVLCVMRYIGVSLYEHDKEKAIKRCGGENNIVEKVTNQGDIYFNCKD